MNIFKKTTQNIDKGLKTWTDEECLRAFEKFLSSRVGIVTQFVKDDDGLITHETITVVCGDKIIVSEPQELEWPLQLMPFPEEHKGMLN